MLASLLYRRATRAGWMSVAAAAAVAGLLAVVLLALDGASASAAAGGCLTPGTGDVSFFCFQPNDSTQPSDSTLAGSSPSLDTTIDFTYPKPHAADSVKDVTVTLAPGVLAIPTAVPEPCAASDLAAGTCPIQSLVGTGTVSAGLPGLPGTALPAYSALYAMQVPAADAGTDVAYFGLDTWLGKSQPQAGTAPLLTANASASITTVSGQPAVQFAFDNLPGALAIGRLAIPIQVDSLSLTIDGSLSNNAAFTRLPTNCQTAAVTTLSADTYDSGTGTGSDSFTPTGCDQLAFTPTLNASATRDASDLGVNFVSTISQPPRQAAQGSITLSVPPATLAPNLLAALQDFGSVVGSAQAVTPILSQPLSGPVTLTGTVQAPALTIAFPAPVPLTLTGSVDIADNQVTFANLPDVPLSSLTVTLSGGATALYDATCTTPSGTVQAAFVDQNNDAPLSVSDGFTVSGCAVATPLATTTTTPATTTATTATPTTATPGKVTPPKVSGGAISGLSKGRAQLHFTLAAGSSKLTSFTLGLPSGLSFNSSSYRRGVKLAGGQVASLELSGGRLTVKLRAASSKLTVTVSAQALAERAALRGRARARKLRTLSTTVVAGSADGRTTKLALKLRT